jgi:hypothetical protein
LLNCTGDATIDTEGLHLTKDRGQQRATFSAGQAQYMEAVPLWDRASGKMASFTTTFHFNITPLGGSSGGDGLAFFLAPPESGVPANFDSSGGGLGLLPKDPNYWNNIAGIIAVEFDTFQNLEYADISDDHIGIDVNSLNSTASTNITSQNNNLKSDFTKMAIVRYNNITKLLVADLNINNTWYNVHKTMSQVGGPWKWKRMHVLTRSYEPVVRILVFLIKKKNP